MKDPEMSKKKKTYAEEPSKSMLNVFSLIIIAS
jgi:hypothetical protein